MDNIIKLLILFGECHIHKAKCISTVPNVRLFSTDLKIFYDSNFNTQQAKSSKDIKTVERDTSCIRNMIDMWYKMQNCDVFILRIQMSLPFTF